MPPTLRSPPERHKAYKGAGSTSTVREQKKKFVLTVRDRISRRKSRKSYKKKISLSEISI